MGIVSDSWTSGQALVSLVSLTELSMSLRDETRVSIFEISRRINMMNILVLTR